MPATRNVRTTWENTSAPFGQTERRCTQCGVWLLEDAAHFSPRVNAAGRGSRFNAWCRPCVRARAAARPRSRRVATGRQFGVEIEFLGSSSRLCVAMRDQGLRCSRQSYNHRVSRTAWKIVPDGSVSGGAELVSPILRGAGGEAALRAAGRALTAAGCTVNKTTGLHVHHDVTDLTVSAFRLLVTNWAASQVAIDGLVAPSRREGRNIFCTPLSSHDLNAVTSLNTMDRNLAADCLNGNRYRTLNLQSYGRYGTVEVRQHQGTVDAEKIIAWVRFGQAMIEAAVAVSRIETGDTAALLDALPLADETHAYLTARAAHLAGRVARAAASDTRTRQRQGPGPDYEHCTCPACEEALVQ